MSRRNVLSHIRNPSIWSDWVRFRAFAGTAQLVHCVQVGLDILQYKADKKNGQTNQRIASQAELQAMW